MIERLNEMKFELEIDMGNDAFRYPDEIYSLLKLVATEVYQVPQKQEQEKIIRDSNGNKVGRWQINRE